MREAVSKCFPLTAGFKIKSKISRTLSGRKAKIINTPLEYIGTGINA
jgi:hypothetical protein